MSEEDNVVPLVPIEGGLSVEECDQQLVVALLEGVLERIRTGKIKPDRMVIVFGEPCKNQDMLAVYHLASNDMLDADELTLLGVGSAMVMDRIMGK